MATIMPDLNEQINYIQDQITFHTSQSERKKLNGTPTHASIRHETAVATLNAIENSLLGLKDNTSSKNTNNSDEIESLFSISAKDIEEIPDELRKVLNLHESDILEVQIVELLRLANRPLVLKELIMGLYRKYDYTVSDRNPFASKLYRMKEQGLIDTVKKGYYILPDKSKPVSDELEDLLS